jgi:hypothetical protein
MANTEMAQPLDDNEMDEALVRGPIPQQVQVRLPVEGIMDLILFYQDGSCIKETDHYRINRSTALGDLDRNGVVRRGRV